MLRKLNNAVNLLGKRPLYFLAVVFDKVTAKTKFAAKMDVGTRDASEVLGVEVESVPMESFSFFVEALSINSPYKRQHVFDVHEFLRDSRLEFFASEGRAQSLAKLLNMYKSDKSSTHGYEYIYQPVFDQVLSESSSLKISEIGLGTNNIEFLSNMGVWGKPGASCRAFRDFDQRITVHGGDIDRRVLFEEDRISTDFVDQLNISSLVSFLSADQFDVLIDDGLHVPRANFNFLSAALSCFRKLPCDALKWIVVEDVVDTCENRDFWSAALLLLPSPLRYWIVKTNTRLVVIVLVPAGC